MEKKQQETKKKPFSKNLLITTDLGLMSPAL